MKKVINLFYFGLLLFAFFPIIPNKLKGLPVIVLFLISIFLFLKKKEYKLNLKKVLTYASIYIFYIISLLYSSSLDKIDKTLTTRISLLIFPLLFGLANTTIKAISEKEKQFFLWTYFTVSILYCGMIVYYFYQIGFITQKVSINLFYSHLTNRMWFINQHPIYASIFVSIGLLFGIKLLYSESSIKYKIVIVIGLVTLFSMLLFLSRKGVLLATILATIPLVLYFQNYYNYKNLLLGIIIVSLMFFISPMTQKRFKEVFNLSSYTKVENTNSTSIRYGIYQCALKKIKEKPIFGHGIGDVKNELNECYSKASSVLLKGKYNSHNQYLSILLSNGIVGLIIFISFLFINFRKAILQNNQLFFSLLTFFSIIMLFENILERQSGVILFSLFINFFAFIDIKKDRNKS